MASNISCELSFGPRVDTGAQKFHCAAMSAAGLEEFRRRIVQDDVRRTALREAGERGRFFEEALVVAEVLSLEVTMEELQAADREGRRTWTERFV
jgi:hypothetical protein